MIIICWWWFWNYPFIILIFWNSYCNLNTVTLSVLLAAEDLKLILFICIHTMFHTFIYFLGSSPIIVLTHLDTNQDRLKLRTQEFEQLNCPRIFQVANYTRDQNTFSKVTDAKMIEILFNSCLVGDQVMQYLLKKTYRSCNCCCSKWYFSFNSLWIFAKKKEWEGWLYSLAYLIVLSKVSF